MEQSENIGELSLALSKAQGMLEGAAKSSDNPFFKSKYADLHECIEAAKTALAKNDLAVIQTTDTDETGSVWIYTTLAHKSGQWVRGRLKMKPKKDDDQSMGSSITYGRRYCFAAIVGLAQKDDDGDSSAGVSDKANDTKDEKKETQKAPKINIEQWIDWIDKHVQSGTATALQKGWKDHVSPFFDKLPAHDKHKLQVAFNDTLNLLTERENKNV